MKKLVVFLLLGFASFALIAGNSSYAADELVDLYPYDQQACLEGTNECTFTKLGSSHWTMEFAGYRYHFVRGADRYVKDFEDDNSNGIITSDEMGTLSWNAFAGLIINDTDADVILGTSNARTDLTSVVHRKYSYFDETGQLAMFEDHISTYYIFNDGTALAPDWRLATEAEATAYDAADPKPETTRLTHIRMALDTVDTDGYVIEPIGYLKWTNADVDTAVDTDPENWSTIINGDGVIYDGNPNYVTVKAGWTVVSWGTLDRGTSNPATTAYIQDMPEFMLDDTLDPMVTMYEEQPAMFAGITALDNDLVTAGVNIVVDYNGTFDLDPMVTASWVDMFDDQGMIINATEKIDYAVTISQDGTDLETIDFTYDSVTDMYTASAAVTAIDSSMFGAGYKATWMATTPEGVAQEVSADIVIGVMPPTFSGVEDRFVDQNVFVDVLKGITADDGYGNDKTMDIEVSYPSSLNPYAPFPGEYTIDLEFTHNVFFPGTDTSYTLDGTEYVSELTVNQVVTNFASLISVYTDVTNLKTSSFGWSSAGVVIEVAGDGTIIQTINRRTWDLVNETYTADAPGDGSGVFTDWIANMTLEENGFVIVIGVSTANYTLARGLNFGDSVAFNNESIPDFSYDIVTEASYVLTVDDMTAPIAIVVNDNYSFYSGEYSNVNNAILANVVAYDFTDSQDNLVKYVSNNGGLNIFLAGTYTVEVTVEDLAGHTAVVEFDVVVMKAIATKADIDAKIDEALANEIQALIDANVLTEADIQALIDANVLTEAAVQTLIDASVEAIPETGCGSAINGTSAIFITFSLVLGASAIFFFRRRR
ncbi:hypothetical protein [Mariniplasma anaerobium]|uniref:Uncharacterized protein n=1 Tax=Mariniplasma anaerobium TaxID=2735436 RepID=A0A7U9TIN7_9MOLU|nr:hypothetical protein [Mariniplasma anaerobium]BCR36829.1 hypothetical protein MPAN_017220 [Mariniplasma anaerobium]